MFDKLIMSTATDLTLWEKIAEWYKNSFLCELLTYLRDTYFTVNFGLYENFTVSETTAETIRLLIPALGVAIVVACLMTARLRVRQGRFVRRLLRSESLSPESAKTLAELELFRDAAIRRELSKGSNLRMVVRCIHEDGRDTGVGVYLDRSSEELLKLYEMEEAEEERKRLAKKAAEEAAEKGDDKNVDEAVDEVDAAEPADAVADGEVPSEPCANEPAAESADAQKEEADDTENQDFPKEITSDVRIKHIGKLPKIDFTTAKFYIPKLLKHRADLRFERRGSSWAPAIASIVLVVLMTAAVCRLLPYVLTLADGIISLMSPE